MRIVISVKLCIIFLLVFGQILLTACNKTGPRFFNIPTPSDSIDFNNSRLTGEDLCSAPLQTDTGWIKGIAGKKTESCAWRGIPYASADRWKSPTPIDNWSGILDASRWGARCMQMNSFFIWLINWDPSGEMSEHCHFVNVWRPQKTGKFPVIIHIHGGGYGILSANQPAMRGDILSADEDLVYVTMNYRLGKLGFLALPALQKENRNKSVGNYGMLDQIEALKWIKQNIESFGGDSNNITLMGDSAGSWSVCSMLASPLAKDLFHKAIMLSGGCNHTQSLFDAYESGESFVQKLPCESADLVCLRNLPANEIVKAQGQTTFVDMSFGPTHDDYVLESDPLTQIKSGDYNSVPLIVGYTRDEMFGNISTYNPELVEDRPDEYLPGIKTLLNTNESTAKKINSIYPLNQTRESPIEAYGEIASDLAFICPAYDLVSTLSEHQNNIWMYRIDFEANKKSKATHGEDVAMVTKTIDRFPAWLMYDRDRKTEAKKLSEVILREFVHFVYEGNPDGYRNGEWERFESEKEALRIYDEIPNHGRFLKNAHCKFLAQYDFSTGW